MPIAASLSTAAFSLLAGTKGHLSDTAATLTKDWPYTNRIKYLFIQREFNAL